MKKEKTAIKALGDGDMARIARLCDTTCTNVRYIHLGMRGVKNTPIQRRVQKLLNKAYELEAQKEKILFNTLNEDAD